MDQFLNQFLTCGTIFAKDQNHLFLGYGKRQWSAEPSSTSPCWYFPDFFLKCKTPWFTHQFWEIVTKDDFQKRMPNKDLTHSLEWSNCQEEIFENSFKDLKVAFANKRLHKAVPYLFQTCQGAPHQDLKRQMLKASLLSTQDTLLQLYGFWDDTEGILGATPEVLFSVRDHQFKTMACAGTLFDEQKIEPDEQNKLLKEHQFVVEGISKAIAPLGNSLLVGDTKWQTFQQLKHLLTPIEMSLERSIKFTDLIKILHPTAAIGTYPKQEGETWLQGFDALIPRKRFGAPCACIFQEKILCLVAIRNVQWDTYKMEIGAGSGVIEESDLEREKKEIEMKINAIKKILHL